MKNDIASLEGAGFGPSPALSKTQLKSLRALKDKKGRLEQGRFLIEGVHLCREALQAEVKLDLLLYTQAGFEVPGVKEVVALAQRRGVSNLRISDPTMQALSDAKTPQGILARVAEYRPLATIEKGDLFILLDQVRDPGNVGTIIRTADAVGADGIFISKGSADAYHPKTLRSTQGSIFHLPIQTEVDPLPLVIDLGAKGFRTFVAEPKAQWLHTEVHFPRRLILIVGNETHGVSDEIKAHADQLIRVPIRGRAESLNVAMATGVILYEALRQREAKRARTDMKKRRPR